MNVYDMITTRITELLENGTVPWKKPWNAATNFPKNLVSKKPYRGINVWLTICQNYESPYWLTFKQATELGGYIKKGMKSTPVIYFQMLDKSGSVADGDTSTNGKIPLLRYYSVFNIDQCEGITPPPTTEVINPFLSIEHAEQIISGMPMAPEIKYGGGRAYYSPALDYCQIPNKTAFNSPEEYYSTMFHELAHATGHVNRLSRKSIMEPSYFGSHEYSKEELVAEMSASFLSGHTGIENTTIENSAAYISGWMKALKNDKTLLVHAAAQAQKAADYILNITHQADQSE